MIEIFVLFSAPSIIRDSLNILLDFTPKDINFDNLVKDIEKTARVEGLHNIHLWSLCSNSNIMDAHIFKNIANMERIEY